MKKCNMCGSQVQDTYNACPNCGNTNLIMDQANMSVAGQPMPGQPMGGMGQPMPGQPVPGMYVQPQQTKGSFGWAVLGFFIPIVGWILYFSWKNKKPGDAKMAGIGGLVGFCFNLIVQFAL